MKLGVKWLSRYTVELRRLGEWTDAQIGLGDYPIFEESHREVLNKKIRDYYMFSEIGFETPGRFARQLSNTMNIIMPYYNQLYETTKLAVNPFMTMDYSVVGKETQTESKNQQNNENTNQTVNHDSTVDKTNSVQQDTGETSNSKTDTTSNTVVSSKRALEYADYNDTTTHEGGTETENFGTTTNTRNGDQTNVKTGDESHTVSQGNVYEHGLEVDSTTPEGFVTTESIEKDTWASGARKYRKRTEQEEDGSDKTTYNQVTDKLTYSDVKDVTSFQGRKDVNKFLENTKDTLSHGNHTDKDNIDTKNDVTGSDDTNASKNIKQTTKADENTVTKDTDVLQRINDLLVKISSDLKKDANTHYAGFSGITMSEMLQKYRETIINIDMMIIRELEPLFITLLN